jgi:hypothetical protein
MIAEELIENEIPDISAKTGTTVEYITKAIKDTCAPFKKAANQPNILKPLNENKLTQIFVEQVEVKIKSNPYVGVKNQYSDLFLGTKGIPDFYFHKVEEGVVHEPLFIVESKRLPSQTFETEYVKGKKQNGGIERFKNEKHGKGLSDCGMLGFIEKENISFWLAKINKWIEDLSMSDVNWSKDEMVNELENRSGFGYLNSIAHTKSSKIMLLHHFWIK